MSGFSSKTFSTVQVGGPLSSFGELNVAQLIPSAQSDFIYGINEITNITASFAGGSISSSNGMAIVNSGVSTSGSGDLGLRRMLKYRPGIGSLARVTAIFDTPVSGNLQLVGPANGECGYYFGYVGTDFGILHYERSQREIRKLTVSTGAGTGNVTVVLNGVSVTVPVTGGSNVNRTSYELSKYDYSSVGGGWYADAIDGTVFFISSRPTSELTGSYSVSGSSISGSFSVVQAGSGSTTTFIPQSSWNIDKMDGTGQSRMVLNTHKGNVYQIGFQYLGFGNAFFGIEDSKTGRIAPVHMIENANSRTTPVLKNPQVRTKAVSLNIGNTTNVALKTVSMASFTEGVNKRLDPRFTVNFEYTTLNTSKVYKPLGAIKVNRVHNNISCFGEIDLLRVAASNTSSGNDLSIAFYKNLPVVGTVNFTYTNQTQSIVSYATLNPDTDTISTNGINPFLVLQVGPNNQNTLELIDEDIVLGLGDVIVVAIKTNGSITGEFTMSWHEQQ
jgi:hypothetical protein